MRIQFDRPERDLGGSELDPVGAEVGDVPHSDSLCEVKEGRYLWSEPRAHDRCDQVDTIRSFDRAPMCFWVVPVERSIGTVAGGGPDRDAKNGQPAGDA